MDVSGIEAGYGATHHGRSFDLRARKPTSFEEAAVVLGVCLVWWGRLGPPHQT
jgi:hypothetical protein